MFDVIIIGGGLSGLNAARLLNIHGKKIALFEQTARLGGLIDTRRTAPKNRTIDMGGAFVRSKHEYTMSLIKLLNINLSRNPLSKSRDMADEAPNGIPYKISHNEELYHLQNNGSDLINRLIDNIKGVTVLKKCTVQSFVEHGENTLTKLFTVHTSRGNYLCKKMVFAIPPKAILKINKSFTQHERVLFTSIEPISLTRILIKYNMTDPANSWLKTISYLGDSSVKVIPINIGTGFFQITCCDKHFADMWGKLDTPNTKIQIKNFLSKHFPNKQIKDPVFFKKKYYEDSLHKWGVNKRTAANHQAIIHLRKHLFIIGDSFSFHQGWYEGAISSSTLVAGIINNQFHETSLGENSVSGLSISTGPNLRYT